MSNFFPINKQRSCPIKLCDVALTGIKENKDEEIVILANVLANEVNVGYHSYGHAILKEVNNIKIKNVLQLSKICDESKKEFMHFQVGTNAQIMLDTNDCRNSLPFILEENNISFDRSPNLRLQILKKLSKKHKILLKNKDETTK